MKQQQQFLSKSQLNVQNVCLNVLLSIYCFKILFMWLECRISIVTVALNVGGAVAWIFNVPSKHFVFWSMGLSLSGAALFMICGILMVRDFRMFDYKRLYAQKAGKKGKKPLADNWLSDRLLNARPFIECFANSLLSAWPIISARTIIECLAHDWVPNRSLVPDRLLSAWHIIDCLTEH